MLRILKGGNTTLILTLSELTTISPVEYVFTFEEEQTHQIVSCVLSDNLSTAITRYDEFLLRDGTDVTFPIDGFYTYKVYQQALGTGTTNTSGLTMVEKGRAYVYKVDAAANEYESTETNNVYDEE